MIVLQLALFCLLFTAMVKYAVRGGAIDGLYFYPKKVQERAIEIGLTTRETMARKRKIFMTEFYIVMLAALVLIIGLWNRISDFKIAYLQALRESCDPVFSDLEVKVSLKRTVKLSLGMSFIMLVLVLIAPHLASPKLVLRFLPKDVYEAGKDHPAPSLPKRLLCHLLLAMAALYMVWAYKDVADGIRREQLSFGEAYKRLLTFLLVEKAFDIVCLDQILCMSTDYYQRCYPETKGCEGWKDRSWNNKNQAARLALYPVFCAALAYMLTKKEK